MCNVHEAISWSFNDTFDTYTPGDLNGQNGWTVTKYNTDAIGTVTVSDPDPLTGTKYTEIRNTDAVIVTSTSTPINVGSLEFKMRHNKYGIFYLYAQTSDAGGQLLFSIQFTPTRGILLEEKGVQTTLLGDYNANQWYAFKIDFDNTQGSEGIFKIYIDGIDYGEHNYVDSESSLFDLGQITFGSESDGLESVSAFTNTDTLALNVATSSQASDALKQLSIRLSSTSISANLDTGLIVTASLDGIASIATSSIQSTTSTVEVDSTTTTESNTTTIGTFIQGIVDHVIDIFTPDVEPSTVPVESTTVQDSLPTENAIPSSVSADVTNNETTTTSF